MGLTIDQALQKAVEAHKAGQVQEADRRYTAILKVQPKHPDANHNLGVLAVSVGKANEALPLLKTALEANPNIAQFWMTYIDALIKLDRLTDAKAVLDQAKSKGAKGDGFDKLEQRLNKTGEEPVGNTSKVQDPPQDQLQALINLYSQGQLQEALQEAETLVQQFPQSAILFNIQGAVLKGLGQLDASVEAYKKALAIKPDHADAHNNMGVTLKEQGKLEEAIEAYKKALAIKPDHAEAYNNMGNTLKEQGKLEEAIEAYKKALAIKPDHAEAYNNMGATLKEQGKLEEAIEAYKKAVSLKPDYSSASHILSSLTGKTTNSAPREYVENLFDQYASKFDQSLVVDLSYDIPEVVAQMSVEKHGNGSLGSILDLGCGTGLTGEKIREHCNYLEGIDVSRKMLELAKSRNVYDKLGHFDMVEYLSNAELDFDYFIATDVFIYVGGLSEVFRLIRGRNKKPGKLIFSTEHSINEGFHLEKSGRYSHSFSYIKELCEEFEFSMSHFSETNLRKEKGDFLVGGLYFLNF